MLPNQQFDKVDDGVNTQTKAPFPSPKKYRLLSTIGWLCLVLSSLIVVYIYLPVFFLMIALPLSVMERFWVGEEVVTTYPCIDAELTISASFDFDAWAGDKYGYTLEYKKGWHTINLYQGGSLYVSNYIHPLPINAENTDGYYLYRPLPLNTRYAVKLFEPPVLPAEVSEIEVISIFVPESVSTEEYTAIVSCLERHVEKINSDLETTIPEFFEQKEAEYDLSPGVSSYTPLRIGGIAHVDPNTLSSILGKYSRLFRAKNSSETAIISYYGGIYHKNKYVGDVFSGSAVVDADPESFASLKDARGQSFIEILEQVQRAFNIQPKSYAIAPEPDQEFFVLNYFSLNITEPFQQGIPTFTRGVYLSTDSLGGQVYVKNYEGIVEIYIRNDSLGINELIGKANIPQNYDGFLMIPLSTKSDDSLPAAQNYYIEAVIINNGVEVKRTRDLHTFCFNIRDYDLCPVFPYKLD